MKKAGQKILNKDFTATIIALHDLGYSEDFFETEVPGFITTRDDQQYPRQAVEVCPFRKVYNELSGVFMNIHKVCTCNGLKGILIIDACPAI
ncbi:hypothetical protein SAMN04487890_104261 [Mucilaginibacter polytrichastri]|nr:hypothetical protein SAMN04487890_104261 [Mucilaginibacter polytrichastri]